MFFLKTIEKNEVVAATMHLGKEQFHIKANLTPPPICGDGPKGEVQSCADFSFDAVRPV
jgi:hypothetical protein